MSLMVGKGSEFTPIDPPKIGVHHAVCCEVYDRGIMQTNFGKKHRIWLVFRVNEKIEGTDSDFDGKWKEVRISANLTLAPRSALRDILESWRGYPLEDEDFDEEGNFDILKVEGVQATLNVGSWSEPDDNGRRWPNDVTVLPPVTGGRNDPALKIEGINEMNCDEYVTLAEREKQRKEFPPPDEPQNKSQGKGKSGKPAAPF